MTFIKFPDEDTGGGGGGGSGDVNGPFSSTDSAIALWNGTTGDLLKDSTIIVNATTILIPQSQVSVPNLNSTAQGTVIVQDGGDLANLTDVTIDPGALNLVDRNVNFVNDGFGLIFNSSTTITGTATDIVFDAAGGTPELTIEANLVTVDAATLQVDSTTTNLDSTTVTAPNIGSSATGDFLVRDAGNNIVTYTGTFPSGDTPVRVTVNDDNYDADGTETIIAMTAITATRTVNLAAAAIYTVGKMIVVKDESGDVSLAIKIIVSADGAETIDGLAQVEIDAAYGVVRLYSDGSNWFSM